MAVYDLEFCAYTEQSAQLNHSQDSAAQKEHEEVIYEKVF